LARSSYSRVFFFFRTHGPGGPLRPTNPLHFSLSDSSWTASGIEHLHRSVMLLDHLLAGRPRGRSPSTIPSITIFTSRWSLHCALASGAVYCNRSCLCICLCVCGGRAVSDPYYSQRAQCLRLSERLFHSSCRWHCPSAVVIHYEEALYQVYAPLPLPLMAPKKGVHNHQLSNHIPRWVKKVNRQGAGARKCCCLVRSFWLPVYNSL